MHLRSQLTSQISMREGTTVGRAAGSDLLEGQLVNSRVPEIAIYLQKSFYRISIDRLHMLSEILHEQTGVHIAASKLIWTAVILNSSNASRLFTIVEQLARWCLKSFGGQRGVRANPLEPPLATGLTFACICKL